MLGTREHRGVLAAATPAPPAAAAVAIRPVDPCMSWESPVHSLLCA